MKLYLNKLSPNVRRVTLTAAALGLEMEELTVDFAKGQHKSPEYTKLNPNGAVPTLVDGDFVLTESRAIMQYLAAKKPESGLLPRDAAGAADVARWQFWDSSHFSPAIGTIVFEKLIKPMMGIGEPDQAKIAEGLAGFRRWGAVLDKHLEGRKHVVGNTLTIADLTLASTLMYAKQVDLPLAEFPRIEAWFGQIANSDAWKKSNP